MQLIIFAGLLGASMVLVTGVGVWLVAQANDLGFNQVTSMTTTDFGRAELVGVARGMMLVQFFLFLIPSLLFAYLADPHPLRFLGLKSPDKKSYILLGILIIAAAFFMVEWLAQINQELISGLLGKSARQWIEKGESDVDNILKNTLSMRNVKELLINLLIIGLLAAVGEEIFFRGVLQRLFIQIFKSPWPGILFTAAVFSALHGQFMGFIPRMLLGVILGALYWYSGSLIPAIAGHFVYNGGQVLLIYFHVVDPNAKDTSSVWTTVIGILSLAVVAFLLYYLGKRSRTTYAEMFPVFREETVFDENN
jgi:membrane protease YdiL (CAAX protease family)